MKILAKTFRFDKGQLQVILLPEEPTLSGSIGSVEYTRWTIAYEDWKKAVAYARAHPVAVDEKDVENIKALMMTKSEWHAYNNGKKWIPQDNKEYNLKGVRMEIKEFMSPMVKLNDSTSGAIMQQIACLIEDDKQ